LEKQNTKQLQKLRFSFEFIVFSSFSYQNVGCLSTH
jgi:hypothetical protein